MKKRSVGLAVLGFLLVICVCWAGESHTLNCSKLGCDFKTRFSFGGSVEGSELSGFCPKCNRTVHITWRNGNGRLAPGNGKPGKAEKAPEVAFSFWDPVTGSDRSLFKCPNNCGEYFVALQGIKEFSYCPKCKKRSLKSGDEVIMYD